MHLTGMLPDEEGIVLDGAGLDTLQQEQTGEHGILLEDVSSDGKSVGHSSGLHGDREELDVLDDSNDLLNLSLNSTDSFGSLPDLDIDELLTGGSTVFLDDVGLGGLHEELSHDSELGYVCAVDSNEETSKIDPSLAGASLDFSDPSVGKNFFGLVFVTMCVVVWVVVG